MAHFLLLLTVFITGTCALIIEIAGLRVLSPYFGNTIYTTSSVISVFLAALSFGYYFGGKYADKYPHVVRMYLIIFGSGASVIILQIISAFILPSLGNNLSGTVGPMISSTFLFLLPGFLLGTISPYTIRLLKENTPKVGVGSISGKVFFWSTFGSILGSVITGFYLIPSFGVSLIVTGTGFALMLLGIIPLIVLNKKKILPKLIIFSSIILAGNFAFGHPKIDALYSTDGLYEKIVVHDITINDRPARVLFNNSALQGGMYLDDEIGTDHFSNYSTYGSLYEYTKPDTKTVAVIGGGAYTVPKVLLIENETIEVDVVEIEPRLYEISKEYFNLQDSPRLHSYITDGRRFLAKSDKQYDFIFLDAYAAHYSIPSHMITQEFFKIVHEKTSNDGLVVANVIGSLEKTDKSLLYSAMRTFTSVFENTYFFATKGADEMGRQNIMFVAMKNAKKEDIDWGEFNDKLINIDKSMLSSYTLLTDDYAPVDYLATRLID